MRRRRHAAGQTLFAEVKGHTASPGLDVDTLYCQLLRRMPGDAVGRGIFAVVVPDIAVKFAARVQLEVRDTLGINVYGVSEDGHVNHVGEPDPAQGKDVSMSKGGGQPSQPGFTNALRNGRTGSSTVRRSFAAMLGDPLGLNANPRKPS